MAHQHDSTPTTEANAHESHEHEHTTLGDLLEEPQDGSKPQTVAHPEEAHDKKGFMEKMKEKLHGGTHKQTEEDTAPVVQNHPTEATFHKDESEEKKGFMDKMKEKLPGHHKSEAEKENVVT